MKQVMMALGLAAVVSAALAGPAGRDKQPKGTGRIELSGRVDLDIKPVGPARLSPDGRHALFVQRREAQDYTYHVLDLDSKKATKVFDSTIGWDDMFTVALGRGVWSPDGTAFAALTSHNGQPMRKGGAARMVLADLDKKKQTVLPCQRTLTIGAVFDRKGNLYYVDMTDPDKEAFRCALRKYDPRTQKVRDVATLDDAAVIGLTMPPDRSRIGAILVRKAEERRPEMRLWAYDLATARSAQSEPAHFDDYAFDGAPCLCWDADASALYANGSKQNDRKKEFSILQFRPFPPGQTKLTVLQQKKKMVALDAFAPGRLSVAAWARTKAPEAFVLDVRTDRTTPCNLPLLLVHRVGRLGLFIDPSRRALCTARILLR